MLLVGMSNGAAAVENSLVFSQKIKHRITTSGNFTSGYIPKRIESRTSDIRIPMFMAALFTIAKKWKQPKCPLMDEWINKVWFNIFIGLLFSLKEEGSSDTCYNMAEP